MKWVQLFAFSALGVALLAGTADASPRISVGIGFGFPCYRPWYGPGPYYYRPIYYAPPPVVVAPAPIYVTAPSVPVVVTQPAVVTVPPASVAVAPAPTVVRAISASSSSDAERSLQLLTHVDEAVRRDAVMDLGRLKAGQAIDPLAATLAGDRSPVVRDAAARALGLIGSPRSLTALQHAAQADTDRDVRHSAQFAVEVIQTNNRGN